MKRQNEKSPASRIAQLEKELEIETALEKVRSRSLAMHQTDELREVVTVVFDKLHDMGIVMAEEAASIVIFTEGTKDLILWNAIPDQLYSKSFHIPYYDTAVIKSLVDAKSEGADFFKRNYTSEEKDHFWKWAVEYSDYKNIPDDRKKHILERKYFACSVAYTKNSAILVSSYEGKLLSEKESAILKRFARVFEQAYVRFLDLHKAEAQAREAEIELGLERVRARSMAMQKSDELKEIIKVVYEQLVHLNIPVEHAGFIMDYNTRDDMHIWLADKHYAPSEITVPYFDSPHWNGFNQAKQKGSNFFAIYSGFEEKNKFYQDLFKLIPGVTEETKEYYFSCPGLAISTVLLENVGLYIENFSGTPYTDDENATLMRFGKVFQQTYTRFLDLKHAEEQAREAQIELGLERVRARAMAMQNSDELNELIGAVFNELTKLDFVVTRCRLWIFDDVTLSCMTWQANQETPAHPLSSFIKYNEHPFYLAILKAWKERSLKLVYELKGDEKKSWDEFLFSETDFSRLPEVVKEGMRAPERVLLSASFSNFGAMQTGSLDPLSDEQMEILARFVKVFDMTYTRFNDLKQAEEHSKEAQIELAMERIRARAMAMHSSSELTEVANVLREQMGLLNQPELEVSAVHLYNDDSETFDSWYTVLSANDPDRKIRNGIFTVRKDCCALIRELITMYRSPVTDYTIEASGEKMQEWFEVLLKAAPVLGENARLRNPGGPKTNYFHFSDFGGGSLVMASLKEPSKEVITLQRRAASVLDLAYRRFLDLKKAEEQAREAKIEAALERVRSRTMAMQKSDELKEVIQLVYEQLKQLNFNIDSANFALNYKESDDFNLWLSSAGQLYPTKVNIPYIDIPIFNRFIEAKKNEVDFLTENYSFEEKNAFFDHFFKNVQGVTDERKEFVMGTAGYARSTVLMKNVTLSIQNYAAIPYSAEENAAIRRFGKVFEQTYTRFLDLQQAEEQAMEAKIETGLERVRAKAMSMQTSEELNELIGTVFGELTKLDFVLTRCLIMIFDPETNSSRWWMANSEAPADPMNYGVQYHKHPAYAACLKAWKERILKWRYDLKGKVKKTWDDFLFVDTELAQLPKPVIEGMKAPGRVILSASFNNFGCLTLVSLEPLSDKHFDLLLRFAKVFDMSYTRFNDLKQAEAQAREAKIQLALERVRARTMAMQQSGELAETAMTLFQQFNGLGITPERIFIGNMDENTRIIEFWGTEQGGNQMSPRFEVNADATTGFSQIFKAWTAKKKTHTVVMKGKELADHVHYVQDVLNMPIQQELLQRQRIMYSAFFSKGLLMIVTPEIQSDETLGILERFAGVFDGTYTRFLDLQKAEAQAREAKIQLALERVRARTMAMQKSEELAEVIQVVHDQLYQLDFNIDVANFVLNYNERDDFDLWLAVHGQRYATKIHIPYFDHPIFNHFNEAKEKGLDFFADSFTFEEKNIFFRHFFENTPEVPEERRAVVFGTAGYARSTVFMKNIALVIANYAAIPYSAAENAVFRRFANVFEQTYTRFLDLQKAEAQARESQIQLGLERVRAAAMAMHNSKDVGNATALVFSEFYKLGITTIRCGVCIIDGPAQQMEVWSASSSPDGMMNMGAGKLDMKAHPLWLYLLDAWQQKKASFSYELAGKELTDYYNAIKNAASYQISESDKPGEFFEINQFCNCYLFNEGCLFAFTQAPFSPEANQVLEKFASVFGLTYRRYLDLTKAEAQAREAQIEAALERVRSRTMAMHDSRGVADTSATMFQELVKLGVEPTVRCGVSIINSVNNLEVWTASLKNDGSITLNYGHLDMTAHPLFMHVFTEWQRKESSTTYELTGDAVRSYFQALNDAPGYPFQYPMDALPEKWGINAFFFREGCLFAFTSEPLSPEMSQVFKRFAGVFGQTYRRYLDLQKAEEQAREAKIETSLERVRSKAMAMRSSEDLADAIGVFYHELGLLSVTPRRCGLGLIDKETRLVELSTMNTIDQGNSIEIIGELKLAGHPVLEGIYDNWLRQEEYHPVLRGNDIKAYYQIIQSQISYPDYPDDAVQYGYYFFFRDGGIFAWTETELPETEVQIYRRFNSVISLTYRRYKDIREAEAQAREAQIEASLERVRSKAMAMRNSNDLLTAASTVFTELQNLGIKQIRSGVGLIAKDFHKAKVYTATSSQSAIDLSLMGEVTLYGHPAFEQQYQSWLKQENYFVALEGAALASYYKILSAGLNADLGAIVKKNQKEYGHWFMFSEGFLYAWSDMEYTDAEIKILERFKNVMELTIRRYIELQKSETQAREAVRQASLDRVRAEIASMRTTKDLERITPLIWNELTILGVPFIRCGVFIMDEQLQQIHTYLSTPDGKAIAAFQLPFNDNSGSGVSQAALLGWRQKQGVTLHWTEEEFKTFSHSLVERGEITSEESYLTQRTVTGLDLHFFPFLQGMLYAGNTEPLSDDDKDLVQSLADAFSTAYARYEDFSSLELAKQEVERTLTDLKATQTKLIQSEKMASLGELTAGIAHEIQNPLNFVNNFSEVNQEMIDEMEEELNAGNIEEALAIAADIKQNEQKINHHGKRADAIVKGMLQHSRTGGGEKQPTNINSVADEYMRLSYHGLRAKDKAFNAEMVTHFDPELPRINVIGQDIGRVLLNLFNNAFYAVNQKKKAVGDGYNPEISVTTLTENGQLIIKVKDNGVGMTYQVKEKIMQPFFTTKPTGEGTGLGLSLTYDMVVKGHGGGIQVNTVEGEGSEFIIQLPIN